MIGLFFNISTNVEKLYAVFPLNIHIIKACNLSLPLRTAILTKLFAMDGHNIQTIVKYLWYF